MTVRQRGSTGRPIHEHRKGTNVEYEGKDFFAADGEPGTWPVLYPMCFFGILENFAGQERFLFDMESGKTSAVNCGRIFPRKVGRDPKVSTTQRRN
jgi:hypothetical protein